MANLGLQNNNPGNLRDPQSGQFRVFSSPQEGQQALVQDLQLKQSGKSSHIKPGASLSDFAKAWAPSSDNNNPENYANTLSKYLGVSTAYAFDKVPTDKLAEGIKVAEGTSSMQTKSSQSQNKMSVEDFGKLIQQKHPEYASKDATLVGQKTLEKYPQYQSKVNMPEKSATGVQGVVQDVANATGIPKLISSGVSLADQVGGLFSDNMQGWANKDKAEGVDLGYFGKIKPLGASANQVDNLKEAMGTGAKAGLTASTLESGAGLLKGLFSGAKTSSALASRPIMELLAKDTGIDATNLSRYTITNSLRNAVRSQALNPETQTLAESALKELESSPVQAVQKTGKLLKLVKSLGWAAVGGDIENRLVGSAKGLIQGIASKALQSGQPGSQDLSQSFTPAKYHP